MLFLELIILKVCHSVIVCFLVIIRLDLSCVKFTRSRISVSRRFISENGESSHILDTTDFRSVSVNINIV